jgi:DNA processing protein
MSQNPPLPSPETVASALLVDRLGRRAARAAIAEQGSARSALAHTNPGGRLAARVAAARLGDDCRRRGISLMGPADDWFPESLRCIPDAPLALYGRGNLALVQATGVAIVGARRASRYGIELAERLAAELTRAGAVVISGLALGVDAAAHRGALAAGGRTAAVLGSGLDRLAPLANAPLARDVLAGDGLLVSEYAPEVTAAPYRFPERNRLIAGLGVGVVVIEASEKSGSLITARIAAEQGREVMAVPGAPGLPNSRGANALIKAGAALVESAEDVLIALGRELPGFALPEGPTSAALTAELAAVLDRLDGRAQSLEALVESTGLDAQDCAVALTELELGGFVQRVTDGYIRRPSRY